MEVDVDSEALEPSAFSPKRLSRRTQIGLAAAAVVILVALLAWFIHYQTRGKYLMGTNDAYTRADSVTVSSKVSGYAEAVLVSDNQDVKAGQPLVRIDSRDYKAQAAQYQAQIEVARAEADNVRSGLNEQSAAIDQARAQLAAAQADAQFAANELARYTPLANSGAETREKLSSLRNQATQAAGVAAERSAALAASQRRVDGLKAQVRQAEAQMAAAQAQLAAVNVNLGSAIVRASIDGRIGDASVRVGQYVQSGTRMMTVVPLQTLYVAANFKETQVGLMRPGQPAEIRVDAMPSVKLRGHVESLSPGTGAVFSLLPPQNATGNFTKIVQRIPVRVALDVGPEARKFLVPGLSLTVTVDTISAKDEIERMKRQELAQGQAGR